MSTVIKDDFDADGLTVVRRLFPAERVTEMCHQLGDYQRKVLPTLGEHAAVYQVRGRPATLRSLTMLHEHSAYFAALLDEPRAFAGQFLNRPIATGYVETFRRGPGCVEPTPPHQDQYFFGPLLNVEPDEAITGWVALTRVDEENGCLRYVKGTHPRGLRPSARSRNGFFPDVVADFGVEDAAREVRVHTDPGDAIVHHPLTINLSAGNASRRERNALVFTYFDRLLGAPQ